MSKFCDLNANIKHIGEVSTSRVDGSPTGAEILTSTNAVTGDVRDTLDGKLKKMDQQFQDRFNTLAPIKWTPNTLINENQSLQVFEHDGLFYLPNVKKLPFTTGAVFNTDNWILSGLLTISTLFNAVDISELSGVTDNRDYIYSLNSDVYVKKGVTIKCHLLPDDDVTIFKGEGKLSTTDIFGNTHIFDIAAANDGGKYSASQRINQAVLLKSAMSIGAVGDSVTDGAFSDGFVTNPHDLSTNNLNSTNYNHSLNGGAGSWFTKFTDHLNKLNDNKFLNANCALSSMKLSDGWAYRNIDYGFFQNVAYGNKIPDIVYLAMGINDQAFTGASQANIDIYFSKFEQFIKKCWGYGASVAVVSVSSQDYPWLQLDAAVKNKISNKFPTVEFVDVAKHLAKSSSWGYTPNSAELWTNPNDTTHPMQMGHCAMADGAYIETMRNRVQFDNVAIMSSDVNAVIKSSTQTYAQTLSSVSGAPYLSEFGMYPAITINNEDVTIERNIYIDRSNASINIFMLSGIAFTDSENAYFRVAIFNKGVKTHDVTMGLPLTAQYSNYLIKNINHGLNIIQILIGGKPSFTYLPAIKILSDNNHSTSTVSTITTVATGYSAAAKFSHDSLPCLWRDYGFGTFNGESPDFVSSNDFFKSGVIRVHSMSKQNAGFLIGWKKLSYGTCLYVARESGVLKVYDYIYNASGGSKSALLATINVNTTNSFNILVTVDTSDKTNPKISIKSGNEPTYTKSGISGGCVAMYNEDGNCDFDVTISQAEL